ncbi:MULTISPECIES: phage tail tape measure protein [unclassified Breznakia]|uniref:phage tail tape measure protein n=1 Tax=unclassified Breznakia TaxID=2623764 RepID=UPI0024739ACE|nr:MULTISPECIES: phage tail tape measure protein [unclassified Breznakia]MDH6367131.1 phage-related minor tail protein [Breznakia sp. PH1-1]MDH6404282.1 phage-related minor tail protein [Breznakia sp. PF1-11]MDH6412019.1 phage-related minor tail protein [Breznakia sp. PFB1-11]MDH6414270.1 phage-related minor tail protein [Breznakia sp. PFB1-14]MDH6416633.1 phage-related minor tail protein [Breznakia sp. PFB1-4]
MAKKYEGITLRVGGDTTELSKALKQPQTESNKLQSQLREVNRALKFDTTNTDLISQKQRLLAENVEKTEEKVNLLKEAQKEFIDQGGDVNNPAYVELQTEIVKAEAKVKALKEEQSGLPASLEAYSAKLDEVGKKAIDVGGSMTKNVTTPIIATGAAAVATWMTIDEAYDNIIVKTGATGEVADKLAASFDKVYGSVPEDSEVVSEAIGEVNTQFGLMDEKLEYTSTYMIKFASINKTDVAQSTIIAKQAMEAYGFTLDEMPSFMDSLTYASQFTGVSVDELSDAVIKGAPQLKAMGLSAQEGAVLIGQLEQSGVDSSTALSSMAKASVEFAKDGKSLSEGLADMQEKIQNSTNETEALNIAAEVFGTKGASRMSDAIRRGTLDISAWGDVSEEAAGTVENTFEATLDPMDKAKIAQNNLALAGASLGDTIQQALGPIFEKLAEIIQNLTKWFKGLDQNTQTIIVTIGGIVAAIGPLLVIFGKVATGISSIITVAGKIGTIFTKIGGVFSTLKGVIMPIISTIGTGLKGLFTLIMANPVIAIITAIIAIFVLLYTKCEWFRDGVHAIIDAVVQFFADFGSNIADIITGVIEWFAQLPEKIGEFIQELIDFVVSFYTRLFQFYTQDIPNFVLGVLSWFGQLPGKIWEFISQIIGNVATLASSLISKGIEAGSGLFNNIVTWVSQLPEKMIEIGTNIVSGIWEGISGAADWLMDKIGGFADDVVGGIADFFGINSPSRVMRDKVGHWLPLGISDGFESTMPLAEKEIMNVLDKSMSHMQKGVDDALAFDMNKNIELSTMSTHSATMLDSMKDNILTAVDNMLGSINIQNSFAIGTTEVASELTPLVNKNMGRLAKRGK